MPKRSFQRFQVTQKRQFLEFALSCYHETSGNNLIIDHNLLLGCLKHSRVKAQEEIKLKFSLNSYVYVTTVVTATFSMVAKFGSTCVFSSGN